MKRLYILCMLTSMHIVASAQPIPTQQYMNQAKYWFYRNRLINEFCKVGPNKGESIPFQSINYNASQKFADMGDGGIQKLGHYIGILASEINLLKNSQQSTTKTIEELYYALNAAKRLDETAETYSFNYNLAELNADPLVPNDYPPYSSNYANQPANWNGWMIRDDHDPKLGSAILKHFANMTGIQKIKTDFGRNVAPFTDKDGSTHPDAHTFNDVSHDQYNHLFIGLRLVQTLLDGTETYYDVSSNTTVNLKSFGMTIATKIINYMSIGSPATAVNCQYILNLENYTATIKWYWKLLYGNVYSSTAALSCSSNGPFIKNGMVPWLFHNPNLQQPSSIQNPVGASFPYLMSQGYAAVGNKFTGSNYFTSTAAQTIWHEMQKGTGVEVWKLGDNIKILTLVALGDSWNYPCTPSLILTPCWREICVDWKRFSIPPKCKKHLKLPIPDGTFCWITSDNFCFNGQQTLCDQAGKAHYEMLPLLYNVVNNKTGFYTYNNIDFLSFYTNSFNNAPCRGPYCYPSGHSESPWASWSLFVTPEAGITTKRENGVSDEGNQGDYNGMDYMLMYNLYNVYQNKVNSTQNPYYVNYDNNLSLNTRTISTPEYYNARSYRDYVDNITGHNGSIVNGILNATNITVTNTGYLNLRAGSTISLTAPFTATGTMTASIYQPTNNWEWEMTICSDGAPVNGGTPSGHREAQNIAESDGQNYVSQLETTPSAIQEDQLNDSYPNPAFGIISIPYSIIQKESVQVFITDIAGNRIATPVSNEHHEAGNYAIDYNTAGLTAGIYYYTLKTSSYLCTKKLIVK